MVEASIEVRLTGLDGSPTTIVVEPGTTAAAILNHEVLKVPAGYRAHLVTQTLEELESGTQIWKSEAGP